MGAELFGITLDHWLLHSALLLFLLAYALRDILWLRVTIATGYMIYIALVAMRGGGFEVLPWYALFVLINLGQAAIVVHERWLRRLTPAEERLRQLAFPTLDKVVVKRMLRLGEWRTLSKGFALTTEGRRGLRLYLVADGRVQVTLRGRFVAVLGDGQFVGEIGFIANRPATATASALSAAEDESRPASCLVWNVAKLRRQMERDDELRSAVHAAVGADLAAKIANQTVSVTREPDLGGLATAGAQA